MSSRVQGAAAATLLALSLLAASMVIGWRLAGPHRSDTAIGRVAFTVDPSLGGEIEGFVPVADWGLRADAFDGLFGLRAELRSLDRSTLSAAAEGDLSALEESERQLRTGAEDAVARAIGWGLGVELVLVAVATALWRNLKPRWLLAAAALAVTVPAVGLSAVIARASFDAKAFASPTFFARGAELHRILEVVENTRVDSAYGSTFASILRSISAVLIRAPAASPGSRDMYVASDLHGNAVVIDSLAQAIAGAPLLFVGDYGQRGGEAESALLAPRVAALSERTLAVSGNHDTRNLMLELLREGVTVMGRSGALDASGSYRGDRIATVDGLRVAGSQDPFEASDAPGSDTRPITFEGLDDPDAAFETELNRLLTWFKRLSPRPAVVMVHQSGLAGALAAALSERGYEEPLTIVTGHDHVQHVDRYGEIVIVDGGTVGAGGVFDAGRASIGFAELHFDPTDAELRSVDLIAIEPFSGQAQASRVVIESLCPEDQRCRFTPAPVETQALE